MADIVDDFLARLIALTPGFSSEIAARLEVDIRQHWGGTEPYVAKRPAARHQLAIGQALAQGQPLAAAVSAAAVSRAQGYRILARPATRRR